MFRGPARTTNEKAEAVESTESVLGRGARVRGRVGGEGDLRIEGRVEGDVHVTGQLSIDEGAEIVGEVDAAVVVISGALSGGLVTRGPVTIRSGARFSGTITGTAAEVSLEEGGSFEGRIEAEFELPTELASHDASHEAKPRPATEPRQAARGR
jgi:cytoskeletal protein CcmA (bactofilin family)